MKKTAMHNLVANPVIFHCLMPLIAIAVQNKRQTISETQSGTFRIKYTPCSPMLPVLVSFTESNCVTAGIVDSRFQLPQASTK